MMIRVHSKEDRAFALQSAIHICGGNSDATMLLRNAQEILNWLCPQPVAGGEPVAADASGQIIEGDGPAADPNAL